MSRAILCGVLKDVILCGVRAKDVVKGKAEIAGRGIRLEQASFAERGTNIVYQTPEAWCLTARAA